MGGLFIFRLRLARWFPPWPGSTRRAWPFGGAQWHPATLPAHLHACQRPLRSPGSNPTTPSRPRRTPGAQGTRPPACSQPGERSIRHTSAKPMPRASSPGSARDSPSSGGARTRAWSCTWSRSACTGRCGAPCSTSARPPAARSAWTTASPT